MEKIKANFKSQPVVAILGHVDHGKTTLLDAIRKTNVASKEVGGITQSIGASEIETKNGRKITFIDTPGHFAFSKMRSRGADVCDIAILVVSGADGVKPQTKEAFSIIKEAKIPFIVCLTKSDLPTFTEDNVLAELEKEGLLFEKRGGDIPWISVSAKTNLNIEKLLELILLVAEVNGIKSEENAVPEAVVIETSKDRKGLLVSVIVKKGILNVGDLLSAGEIRAKIRAIFNTKGISVKNIFPGQGGQILGFEEDPGVGSRLTLEKDAKPELAKIKNEPLESKDGVSIIIKAKNAGSLEAIVAGLPQEVNVVGSGVGEVNETDVFNAKDAGCIYIFTFETKAPSSVIKLAETEAVKIESFNIIYSLIEKIDEIVKGSQKKILGEAQVLAVFPFDNKKIAGCKMLSGKISKIDKLFLKRGEKEEGPISIISMKKGRQEISETKAQEEFGVLLNPQLDFTIGDVLVSVAK